MDDGSEIPPLDPEALARRYAKIGPNQPAGHGSDGADEEGRSPDLAGPPRK